MGVFNPFLSFSSCGQIRCYSEGLILLLKKKNDKNVQSPKNMQRAEGLRVGVVDVCQVEAVAKGKKSNLKK